MKPERMFFLELLLILVPALLLTKMYSLTVVRCDEMREKFNSISIRRLRTFGKRGMIFSRDNKVLAKDVPVYSLYLFPMLSFTSIGIQNVSEDFDVPMETLKRAAEEWRAHPYIPVLVKANLSVKELMKYELHKDEYSGFVVLGEPRRSYEGGESMGTVLGYVAESSEEDVKSGREYGEQVGKLGVEKYYDGRLRGGKGFSVVRVSRSGKTEEVVETAVPPRGKNLRLTVDESLTSFIYTLLDEDGTPGCVIVMRGDTGDILSIVSYPSFDPQQMTALGDPEVKLGYMNDPRTPLLNRCISGTYPPGSIFKLVVAVAALESQAVSVDEEFSCPGFFVLGNQRFGCWKEEGHGSVNLHDAIVKSCDVTFYKVGLRVGIEGLVEWAKKFGLGEITDVDLPYEKSGLVPTPRWKYRKTGEAWVRGDTVNMSIGQGFLLVTPLQVAVLTAVFANGGYLVRPRVWAEREVVLDKVGVSEETLSFVVEAMRDVVEEGTGRACKIPGHEVYGKTGTAEFGTLEPHSWFTSFSYVNGYPVVVTVLLEHKGHGGEFAAPVARKIWKYIYDRGGTL